MCWRKSPKCFKNNKYDNKVLNLYRNYIATLKVTDENFEVRALVHDAVLISIPIGNEDKEVKIAQRIMEESAEFVIGNKIRVGIEKVDPHFKVKDKHKETFNLIFKKIDEYNKIFDLKIDAK